MCQYARLPRKNSPKVFTENMYTSAEVATAVDVAADVTTVVAEMATADVAMATADVAVTKK